MKTCELCHLVVDTNCTNESTLVLNVVGDARYKYKLGFVHAECLAEAERMLSGKSRAVSNSSTDSTRVVATIPHGN